MLNEINKIKLKGQISNYRKSLDHEVIKAKILEEKNKKNKIQNNKNNADSKALQEQEKKKKEAAIEKLKEELKNRFSEEEEKKLVDEYENNKERQHLREMQDEYVTVVNLERLFLSFLVQQLQKRKVKIDMDFMQKLLMTESELDAMEEKNIEQKIMSFQYIKKAFNFKRKIDWREAQEEYSKHLGSCSIF